MSLYTITFDSSDSNEEEAVSEQKVLNECEPDDIPTLVSPPRKPKPVRRIRVMESPDTPKFHGSNNPIIKHLEVIREKKVKMNGTRVFFRGMHNGQQIFLAKAKHADSKRIPITTDSEIHLKNKNLHDLATENDNTDFTLIDNTTAMHLLSVQFGAKTQSDELRKMFVTFLAPAKLPSRISSVPMKKNTRDIDGKECKASIKNSLLQDEDGNEIMAIRKTAKNVLHVETAVEVDSLWLFAIGISAFLGRKPTQ